MLQKLPKLIIMDQKVQGQPLQPMTDGKPHPMVGVFQEVLRRARARKSCPDEASALTDLGRAVMQTGDPAGALPFLNAAVPLYRQVGDNEREGLNAELISLCYRAKGDLPRAAEALKIAEEGGNQELSAWRHFMLGSLNVQIGDNERAGSFFHTAVAQAEAIRLDALLPSSLLALAETFSDRGIHDKGQPFYRRAIELFGERGEVVQESRAPTWAWTCS